MNPKFNLGDVVRCKAGGSSLVVGMVIDNDELPASYHCHYWNGNHNTFQSYDFPECVLELIEIQNND